MNIFIHEVGLRDGLQVEKETVPLEKKIEWAKALFATGIKIIQLGSFVHPVKVPTMADTDELFRYFSKSENKPSGITLSGLVLNEKGMERGMDCGVDMFCMGVSASETHSRKNTGMSTDEALKRIINMAKEAAGNKKEVQVSVQSAFGCGFEGVVPKERVLWIVSGYLENGITNISLADTAGMAHPLQVRELISEIVKISEKANIICHFHDTYGMGIANSLAAYESGVNYFESAVAGLGGCPFTAKASGNVCTEDLVYMFQKMEMCGSIDISKLSEIARQVEGFFGREMPGRYYKLFQKTN